MPRQGRLDAAQLLAPDRNALPDRRRIAPGAYRRRHPATHPLGHHQGARAAPRRHLPPAHPRRGRGALAVPVRPPAPRARSRPREHGRPPALRADRATAFPSDPGRARARLSTSPMRLLVVRHAIAEDREAFARSHKDDADRPLTSEGRRKMERAALGLKELLPELDVLAASPYKRAVDTAEIIAGAYGGLPVQPVAELAPGAGVDRVVGRLTSPQ